MGISGTTPVLSSQEYSDSFIRGGPGPLDNSPRSRNDGPLHHNFNSGRSRGLSPRETRSAGLSGDGTWVQQQFSVNLCTFETRLAIKVFK
ncbi:hypothetical protein AVEN_52928-1 [Araneus ventricosus]|uniref:Uncharacterized protein n=1 Tax=Araneus ventricosus TaxID=182803 RepID=A0A4Y2FGS6_ARAVE|nr:hypothetical protein AVEN_52928-1 [Araneus ventricosus]